MGLCPLQQNVILRQSKIINITFQINHALAQGAPSPGLQAIHAPPHPLIIDWEHLAPPFL
jgi:hypothetical protein